MCELGEVIGGGGVYGVRVRVENRVVWKGGMMNVGNGGRLNGREVRVEREMLNLGGDIYEEVLVVRLVKGIRGEEKFESGEELGGEVKEDEERVVDVFEKEGE